MLGYDAYALWFLGYPNQALQRSYESLKLAETLSHPLSLAFAHHYVARIHQHRREARGVQEHAEQAIAISTEQGFQPRRAVGMILLGWALAAQGQSAAGIAQMQQGLTDTEAMETGVVTRVYFLALLAEAYGQTGEIDAALRILDQALAAVPKGRAYEAEVYRLKGAWLLKQTGTNALQAETCLQKALDIAQQQQAKSLELRAAMSLARLWQQQEKQDEALTLLADVYDGFTEGFDTADLLEVKRLLKELR